MEVVLLGVDLAELLCNLMANWSSYFTSREGSLVEEQMTWKIPNWMPNGHVLFLYERKLIVNK